MKRIIPLCVLAFALLSLSSCLSHKAQYKGDWSYHKQITDPYYTVYLIGDAGNAPMNESTLVFEYLKKELSQEDENAAIVWLGDNIYPVGLAPYSSPYYPEGRHRLMAQLETMKKFKGKKIFVPGNHDWYAYGRIGLRRQELLIDSVLAQTPNPTQQQNFFIPDKGCGDPQCIELTDDITLLLMDSHWFLNEKARAGDQSVCQVTSPAEFLASLDNLIKENKDKSIIVASHHPPFTYAHHGGKFPLKDNLFPLTQLVDWLYLPLPVGYMFNQLRVRISEQDVYHPLYKSYRNNLVESLSKNGRSIVASGHEHTLQLIENNNQYFIVSGSGTKKNKVGLGTDSKFSIGEKGYVKVIFEDAKNALLQFIVPGHFESHNNVAYERRIRLQ